MGHIGQIPLSRTAVCPLMSEQKYLILLSFINPPKFSPFLSLTVYSSLPENPISFLTAFYSPCFSSSPANNAASSHGYRTQMPFYFAQRRSLSASTELIALSNDSHPVRPIVLVEYALSASAICSADWQPLCHLLIFVVFFMLKSLDFFPILPK